MIESINLNPTSYITFSTKKWAFKQNLPEFLKISLPLLNFYRPTAAYLILLNGVLNFPDESKRCLESFQGKSYGRGFYKLIAAVFSVQIVFSTFSNHHAALVLTSAKEIMNNADQLYRGTTSKSKVSFKLFQNVVNLTSLIMPSPQIKTICFAAQMVLQTGKIMQTGRKKGFSARLIVKSLVTVAYTYQMTQQIKCL